MYLSVSSAEIGWPCSQLSLHIIGVFLKAKLRTMKQITDLQHVRWFPVRHCQPISLDSGPRY